jgi:hypothetical protein
MTNAYLNSMSESSRFGLASQNLLNKVDKLRELNIKAIQLPQVSNRKSTN